MKKNSSSFCLSLDSNLFFYSDRRKNHYVASRISASPFSVVSHKSNVPQIVICSLSIFISLPRFITRPSSQIRKFGITAGNSCSVVATENTDSDVVGMEKVDSDGDGTLNGGDGYGEVIVKDLGEGKKERKLFFNRDSLQALIPLVGLSPR
ncbi:hypothetical protein Tco_0848215 [Tanacetum coccineum]